MAENKQAPAAPQPKKVPVVNQVKSILGEENVKKRFQEVLGKKRGTIVNVGSSVYGINRQCSKCHTCIEEV